MMNQINNRSAQRQKSKVDLLYSSISEVNVSHGLSCNSEMFNQMIFNNQPENDAIIEEDEQSLI